MTFKKLKFAQSILRKLATEKTAVVGAVLGTGLTAMGGVMSGKQAIDSVKSIPGQIKGYKTGFKWSANPASRLG